MIELLVELLRSQQAWLPPVIYAVLFVIIAFGVLMYFCLWPAIKAIYFYYNKFLKLLDIPEQFERNGGSSLIDVIDKIRTDLIFLKKSVLILNGENRAIMSFLGESTPPIIFWESDKDGRWTSVSRRWTELSGLGLDESIGFGWANALEENSRNKVLDAWFDAVEQKREFHFDFKIYNHISDRYTDVEGHSLIIRDEHGDPIRYIGIVIPKD